MKERILFYLPLPIPFAGASWNRISFFAEYTKSKGYDTTIAGAFSATTIKKAGSITWNNGIRIINVMPIINTANGFSLIFNGLSSFLTSILVFAFLRPHVVIISVPPGETALGSFIVGKLFRTKKIVIDYRDEWEDYTIKTTSHIYRRCYKYLKSIMTKCYSKCDLLLAVTEALANSLLMRGIKNVKVLTNGADLNVFKTYNREVSRTKIGFAKHDFIFVYSGTIGLYYRLDIVIRALKQAICKGYNIKLLMVGNGAKEDLEKVDGLIKENDLQNSIFYLGTKMDRAELAEILSGSDVGIIPYDANPLWKNSLPSKALEYLACGLPVIATVYEDSVLAKLVYENKVGLISEPENIDELAANIEKIYTNPSFLAEAGKMATLLIEEHFDRNKIAERLVSTLFA